MSEKSSYYEDIGESSFPTQSRSERTQIGKNRRSGKNGFNWRSRRIGGGMALVIIIGVIIYFTSEKKITKERN